MGMRTKTTLAFLALGFAASIANPSFSAECYAVTKRVTPTQGKGPSIPKSKNSRIIGYEKSTDEVVVLRTVQDSNKEAYLLVNGGQVSANVKQKTVQSL